MTVEGSLSAIVQLRNRIFLEQNAVSHPIHIALVSSRRPLIFLSESPDPVRESSEEIGQELRSGTKFYSV